MSDRPDTLDRILTDLATRVDFPPTPDLAASVHAALAAQRIEPATLRARPEWRRATRWLALAAAIVLLALIAVAAIPQARHAVADWLGLPGIHIVIEHGQPGATATPTAGGVSAPSVLFGQPVSLADASRVAGFPVRVPARAPLGKPAGIYVRQVQAGTMVSLVYRPNAGLPEVGSTGVGAYLMELRTGSDAMWMVKTVPSDRIQFLQIDGVSAYWLTGAEVFFNPDPSILSNQSAPARESGNVLLWAEGGVTYRLETKLDQNQAVAIARSLLWTPTTPVPAAGP